MRLADRGLVFDAAGRPPHERICFFDSLCRTRSGTWLCGFTIGAKKHDLNGTIRLTRSLNDGRSWEEIPFRFPTEIAGVRGSIGGAEMVEGAPGKLLVFSSWFDRSDPDRPMFDPVTEGIWHAKLLVAESPDEGLTWSEWREVETPGLTGCALTGPPLRWSDGTIALAFESFKHYDDPAPARHAAWLLVSRDGGASFDRRFLVARDPENKVYYWDQRLCTTANVGEFIGLFWTHDRSAQRDLNVCFLKSTLQDGDQALSDPVVTTMPGQIAAPLALPDGRILAFVVDRDRPGTMKLWQSADGGVTWPGDEALTVHIHEETAAVTQGKEQIDFTEYWDDMRKWSFGHPSARLIDDRTVLLTFYAGSPQEMSIHWARVELS